MSRRFGRGKKFDRPSSRQPNLIGRSMANDFYDSVGVVRPYLLRKWTTRVNNRPPNPIGRSKSKALYLTLVGTDVLGGPRTPAYRKQSARDPSLRRPTLSFLSKAKNPVGRLHSRMTRAEGAFLLPRMRNGSSICEANIAARPLPRKGLCRRNSPNPPPQGSDWNG